MDIYNSLWIFDACERKYFRAVTWDVNKSRKADTREILGGPRWRSRLYTPGSTPVHIMVIYYRMDAWTSTQHVDDVHNRHEQLTRRIKMGVQYWRAWTKSRYVWCPNNCHVWSWIFMRWQSIGAGIPTPLLQNNMRRSINADDRQRCLSEAGTSDIDTMVFQYNTQEGRKGWG